MPDADYDISGLTFPTGLTFDPAGDLLIISGGDVRRFSVPAAGPVELDAFITDTAEFDINNVAYITFKPLP